eukprot:COSAG02_NODE_32084_length_522_cov_1.222222_1_plen_49_part_10
MMQTAQKARALLHQVWDVYSQRVRTATTHFSPPAPLFDGRHRRLLPLLW